MQRFPLENWSFLGTTIIEISGSIFQGFSSELHRCFGDNTLGISVESVNITPFELR